MESAQPPVPPQVAAQQGPPLRQFAQSAGGAAPQQDSNALASQLLDGIRKQMTQLAQVLQTTKPELIPILKQSIQALVMVSGKIKAAGGGQQGGAPDGGNQGTAQDGAPQDSQGGGSMGMPQ